MKKDSIGKLIHYERNKNKISQQELCSGVCSVSALQRLESGERLPDFFVLERIIERLGKSINKIEFLYSEADYEIYYLREVIEKALEQKKYSEVEHALRYYESRTEVKEPLHRQYVCKICAVIMAHKERKHEEAEELFEKALKETVSDFSLSNIDNFLMGEEEVLLLLLWIQEKIERDEHSFLLEGSRLLHYIERVCKDEEVKANVYCKAAWILGTVSIKQKNWLDALWYTLQGEKILTENGLLMHLPQFLDRILDLTEKRDVSTYVEWKKQTEALKQLYEEYGEVWKTESIELWKKYRQLEIYLVSELFEQERKILKQSQEKLADAIELDQKTISRIESGRYKPKRGTFRKMREYLQIDRDICVTRIIVEDYNLLELERNIAKLNHYRREREAEVLYKELKSKLSMEWRENQQYIKYMDVLFANQLGRVSAEEAIKSCIEAFRVTRENLDINQIEQVVLGRMEAAIINYIAKCYDKIGEKEKAIELLEKAVRGYQNSKVDIKYHYVALALIYEHLAINYEECDKFEEAISWCDKAIRLDLSCKRGIGMGFILEQKIYTIDRMSGDRSSSKDKYKQAYQILKLMRKERQMKSLQKIFYEWYEDVIDI